MPSICNGIPNAAGFGHSSLDRHPINSSVLNYVPLEAPVRARRSACFLTRSMPRFFVFTVSLFLFISEVQDLSVLGEKSSSTESLMHAQGSAVGAAERLTWRS